MSQQFDDNEGMATCGSDVQRRHSVRIPRVHPRSAGDQDLGAREIAVAGRLQQRCPSAVGGFDVRPARDEELDNGGAF